MAVAANMELVTFPAPMVVAKLPVPEPVTSPVKVMVWSPVLVPETVALSEAVKVFPSAMVKVALEAGAVMATLFMEVAVATPRVGVTKVGEEANTNVPEPVSSEITPANSEEVVAAKALSLLVVYTPFVTVPAFPEILPVIVELKVFVPAKVCVPVVTIPGFVPSAGAKLKVVLEILAPFAVELPATEPIVVTPPEEGVDQEMVPDPLVLNTCPEVPSVFGKVIVPVVNFPEVATEVTLEFPS